MERIRRRHQPDTVYHSTTPMPRTELQRFAELLQAFVQLAHGRVDVQLRGSASPPPLGFAVRLQPGPLTGGVEIVLSLERTTIRSWTGNARAGEERPLGVDLSSGFRYECLLFPNADSLAVTLLSRMEDLLSAADSERLR